MKIAMDSARLRPVLRTASHRTSSGRWRAVNMMSTAAANGAHVITDSTGQPVILCSLNVEECGWAAGPLRASGAHRGAVATRELPCCLCAFGAHRGAVATAGQLRVRPARLTAHALA